MMKLGAHVSTSGGVDNAPANAVEIGAECLQVFSRNQNRWKSKAITAKAAARSREELATSGVGPAMAHDSYLINLASQDEEKLLKSRAAFDDELLRADLLGIPYVVMHPGSHLGAGVEAGLRAFTAQLDRCIEETVPDSPVQVLLETTAGQGTNLGFEFGQLRDIIGQSRVPDRLGICVDTCHIFAAGYDLRTREAYEETVAGMDEAFGLDRIRAWHINDSKKELGSRVDRHADIGEGFLGLDPFRFLIPDERWDGHCGCLETPAGPEGWADQLVLLRGLRES